MTDFRIIRIENGKQEVSARELYNFLEPSTPFRKWIERMLKYGFVEGVDFRLLTDKNVQQNNKTSSLLLKNMKQKGRGGHNKKDYILSLDCAKGIAMVQRTEKGRQIRAYFLECERIAHTKESVQLQALRKELGIYKRMEQIRTIRRMLNAEMRILKEKLQEINPVTIPTNATQLTLNF